MTVSTIGSNATQTPTEQRTNGTGSIASVSISDVGAEKSGKSAGNDTVHISSQAIDLRGLEAHIAQLPDADKSRVTQIRNQIANGQYQINFDKVAEKILGLEAEL